MFAHSGVEACGRLWCHPALVALCVCEMQSTDSVQFQLQQGYQDRHLLVFTGATTTTCRCPAGRSTVRQCSVAVLTDCQRCGGLKQHTRIILQFWRSES